MYLHIFILTVAVLEFIMLPFSATCSLAEDIESNKPLKSSGKICSIPLPDPKKLSAEEKEWFTSFQEGTFYAQGWKDITSKILNKITKESEKEKLRRSLNLLGIRIGCEWSKDNSVRKINTDMLEQWGAKLQKTAEEKPDELPVLIANIRQKVFDLVK